MGEKAVILVLWRRDLLLPREISVFQNGAEETISSAEVFFRPKPHQPPWLPPIVVNQNRLFIHPSHNFLIGISHDLREQIPYVIQDNLERSGHVRIKNKIPHNGITAAQITQGVHHPPAKRRFVHHGKTVFPPAILKNLAA